MSIDNDSLNRPPHIQQQSTGSFKSFKLLALLAAVLFIAGMGGHLLGIRNSQSIPHVSQDIGQLWPAQLSETPTPTQLPQGIVHEGTILKRYTGQFFSFQYPEEWSLLETNNSSLKLEKEQHWDKQGLYPAQTVKATISVQVINGAQDTTLDKLFESRYRRGEDENLFALTKKSASKTVLGGVEAIAVQFPGAAGYIDESTITIYRGRGYEISIIGVAVQGSHEAYKTIVKTFTFH